MAADPGSAPVPVTVEQLLEQTAGQHQAVELLARLIVEMDKGTRYLGGIYSLLKEQEGLATGLSDLAPLLVGMVTGVGAPPAAAPRTVIEGEIVG